jgi:uncharacterized membrane protein
MGLNAMLRLSLASVLLSFSKPSSLHYGVGAQTLIESLTQTQRYGSAYVAWQALSQTSPDIVAEEALITLFQGLFNRLRDASEIASFQVLGEICETLATSAVLSDMNNLYLVVGAGSYLICIRASVPVCCNVAWQFVSEMHERFPALAKRMTRQLSGESLPPMQRAEQLEEKEGQLQEALRELDKELREHSVRNVSLARDIERENLEDIFMPLANLVRSGDSVPTDILARIEAVSPETIITLHPRQRTATRNDRIRHPLLGDMISYNQSRLKCLYRVAELRLELVELGKSRKELASEFEAARQESQQLLESISSGTLILQEVFKIVGIV